MGPLFGFNNQLTLTLGRAAVNIQPRPKGNEGPAALVGLAHASRVGLRPEVPWVRTVAQNTHGNIKRCYNRLPV